MHLDPRSLKYHLQKIKSKRKSKASTTKNLFWQGALARLKTRAFEYLYATANYTFHDWPYYLATEKYFPLPLNCIIQDKSLLCFWNTFFLSFVCLVATCHARIELLFTWPILVSCDSTLTISMARPFLWTSAETFHGINIYCNILRRSLSAWIKQFLTGPFKGK